MNVPEVEVRAVPGDAFLLDVREPEEWRAGHAPTAAHIPLMQLPHRLDEVPTDVPVYVICRSGHRSAHATAWLNRNGRDATNVEGGMQAWAAAGREMTAENGGEPYVA